MIEKLHRSCLFRIILVILVLPATGCSLINGGSANIKYTHVQAEFDGDDYVNEEKIGDVGFSLKNVQHPNKFRPWSFNMKIRPSFHADRNTYVPKTPDANLPQYKIHRFIAMGNLKFNAHFPIGNLVFTLGFGGSLYKQTSNQGLKTIKTREIRKVELGWVNFLSDRIFLLFGPRLFIEEYETYVFALRIGYYWGDT